MTDQERVLEAMARANAEAGDFGRGITAALRAATELGWELVRHEEPSHEGIADAHVLAAIDTHANAIAAAIRAAKEKT